MGAVGPAELRPSRRVVTSAGLVLTLLAMTLGCGGRGGGDGPPPDIVLVTIESLRTDHLSVYTGERETDPALARLAAESMVYDRAHAVTSWTLTSHASLFTGLYPSVHRTTRPLSRLDDSYVTLAEELAARGYQTAAIVSGPFLRTQHNLNQGFEHYDESPANASHSDAHGDVTNPAMERAIARFFDEVRDPSRPLFLFAYYWDPHYDFIPPAPFDTMFVDDACTPIDMRRFETGDTVHPGMADGELRYVRSQYDGEIRWTDEHLDRLFERLKRELRWEDAAIVVTADHGEEFFDHGEKGHKNNLYDETVHVPLIVKYPGGEPRGRDDRLVSLVDVMPTLLPLTGDGPGFTQGVSLLEPQPSLDRTIYFELLALEFSGARVTDREFFVALRRGDTKFIARPGRQLFELYDLAADPLERDELSAEDPETTSRWVDELRRWHLAMQDLAARFEESGEAALDPEALERLRSLGYVQ
jgi:arylsulfatase A-like enzyme